MDASQINATFYLLPDNTQAEDTLQQACLQALACYRANKRAFVYTDDRATAEQVDELLWSFDADSFVPHNLPGEGPDTGAWVEISWQAPSNSRQVLINLSSTVPNFAAHFEQIIDFVPAPTQAKQDARERFKFLRQHGVNVTTAQAL
ncbi:DNA polymerase III subunit chi [Thalassotalea agarivorans]|uniref:DNA polymerase III, chi subunit n=1 Tax=Thalassotalea agarivorans TaxID=349064 RepID=A0A1I0I550_THASX|nr:DNA polymerase III subunit chi [Thalassotalea agarivorans]SET91621.1 DNA polymerase III, chi subunit [Thalassotalea agarivorans]